MRKIFVILMLLYCSCVLAQPVIFQEKIRVDKKNQVENLDDHIARFFELDGLARVEDSNNIFKGSVSFFSREGIFKTKHTYEYEVKFTNTDNKRIDLYYTVLSSNSLRTVCDMSQKQEPAENDFKKYLDEAEHRCWGQSKRLDDYIESGFTNFKEKDVEVLDYLNYVVDDSSLSYYKIIKSKKNLSKETLFNILVKYFSYAYNNGKSVIQNTDKENCIILAKGIYERAHIYSGVVTEKYDIPHIVRIDCRDGRVKATITIQEYRIFREGKKLEFWTIDDKGFTRIPTMYHPFGKEDDEEMDECLEKLEKLIVAHFTELEKVIDEGNTSVDNFDNW